MAQFLQAAAYGVVQGGLLALVAVGFSLVWGVMNVINFSHGALAVTGAYLAWFLNVRFGLDPFLAIPIVAVVLFGFGYVIQRGLINLVINAPIFLTLLLTFGLSLVLLNGLQLLFTADDRTIDTAYASQSFAIGAVKVPTAGLPRAFSR